MAISQNTRFGLLLIVGFVLGILSWHYSTLVKKQRLANVHSIPQAVKHLDLETVSTPQINYQLLETLLGSVEARFQAEEKYRQSIEIIENLVNSISQVRTASLPAAAADPPDDSPGDAVKKIRAFSPLEQANQAYANALTLAEEHNVAGAVTLLNKILQEMPDFKDARETLAAIYIEQKQYSKAADLLNAGLSLDPNYPPFVSLQARILAVDGKIKQALAVLNNVSPPVNDYPDYYAFLAALNQQAGNYLVSAKIYEELIAIQPDNGLWYLGKAVNLNAEGQPQEALSAYQHAQASANLTPPLRAYVDEQIRSLE